MKAIFDSIPESNQFPLTELLLAVCDEVPFSETIPVVVERLGGVGEAVWLYEQKIDQGLELKLELKVIKQLSLCSDAVVDELLCRLGPVYFGISDATFMFVQSTDKGLEARISSNFADVREVPDVVFRTDFAS